MLLREFDREQFVFLHIDDISKQPDAALQRIAAKCRERGVPVPSAAQELRSDAAANTQRAPKLNESTQLDATLEPDEATLRELAAYYRPHNERLFKLLGRDLG